MERLPLNRALGFTILEPLFAVALLSLSALMIVAGLAYAGERTEQVRAHGKAVLLAEEGIEAVRSIRATGYGALVPGSYGISTTTNAWSLAPGRDTIDGLYIRTLLLTADAPGVTSVLSQVTWEQAGIGQEVILETILTDWPQ